MRLIHGDTGTSCLLCSTALRFLLRVFTGICSFATEGFSSFLVFQLYSVTVVVATDTLAGMFSVEDEPLKVKPLGHKGGASSTLLGVSKLFSEWFISYSSANNMGSRTVSCSVVSDSL